jgi:hypothetical protein
MATGLRKSFGDQVVLAGVDLNLAQPGATEHDVVAAVGSNLQRPQHSDPHSSILPRGYPGTRARASSTMASSGVVAP